MFDIKELERVNEGLKKIKLLSNASITIISKNGSIGRTIADVYIKSKRIFLRPDYLDFENFLVMDELSQIMLRLLNEL